MMLLRSVAVATLATATASAAAAANDKYAITAEEHAACDGDAISLCSTITPSEDKLLACMKSNRDHLSPICKVVFTAGLRRRHIPL